MRANGQIADWTGLSSGRSKPSDVVQTFATTGHPWNYKRVYRIYCVLKLNKRRPGKRRLPTIYPAPLVLPKALNDCWFAEFAKYFVAVIAERLQPS